MDTHKTGRKTRGNEMQQFKGVKVRFAIILSLLLMHLITAPMLEMEFALPAIVAVLGLATISNIVSILWIAWGKAVRYRLVFAVPVDIFLVTLGIHYVGGIETLFSWVYAVILIAIAALYGVKAGFLAACLSSVMYSLLLFGEFKGVIPHIDFKYVSRIYLRDDTFYLYTKLFSDNALFFLSAIVSGLLSDRLRRRKTEVEHRNAEILSMQETLRQHICGLEKAVTERTGELSAANEQLRREISERNRIEQHLREYANRYQIMAQEAAYILCTVDMETGIITSANDFASKVLGYPLDNIVGKVPFLDLAHPDDRERIILRLREIVAERKRDPSLEMRLRKADGSYMIAEINGALSYGPNGAVETFTGVVRDVTEQKQAERALRESEERYRALVDNSLTGICVLQNERFRFSNKRLSEISGYTPEELEGKSFLDLVHPEDREFSRDVFVKRISGRLPMNTYQYRGITKDGQTRWIETFSTITEYRGEPALLVNLIDITERKWAEEALKNSEERLKLIFEYAPDAYYLNDFDGTFVDGNKAVEELIGYRKDELVGKSFLDLGLLPPDQMAKAAAHLAANREGRATGPAELMLNRKDGTRVTVEVRTFAVKIGDQPLALGIARDITERKRAEQQVRESEAKYRSLFENSVDVVYITSDDGRLIDINPAGVELFGASSKEELLRLNVAHDIYANPEDRQAFLEAITAQGFVRDYEVMLKNKNGELTNMLVTASAMRDENGQIVAHQGIMRNVTEKRRLEQQLFQAQKMESVGRLAGGIAHDFNNILGGILGYASFLKTKASVDHPFYKYIDTIEQGAVRAAELTSQLLAFARGGKYNTRPSDLNGIVNETLKLIGRTFDKCIEIRTALHPELGAVEADPAQMQQVLMNLCVNAGDAMPNGGILCIETGPVTINEKHAERHAELKPGEYVCLSVSDTGIGMDKETRQKVFEPFFTTKEEGKGTGLGLSMVYGVVKNHGGHVNVYSEAGHGSTFRVYLPVNGKPEIGQIAELEIPEGGTEVVLVIDDEAPIRSLAEDILTSYGYRVLCVEDGAEGVQIYRDSWNEIDLVILDMVMPKIGGRETFLKLKEINPSIKALLSTGYSQNEKTKEILESGVHGFIQKPYDVNELLTKVRMVLDEKIRV